MDSSCSSINLSEIEFKAQKEEFYLFNDQRKEKFNKSSVEKKKHKHVSILEPEEDVKNRSNHRLSINLKNVKNTPN